MTFIHSMQILDTTLILVRHYSIKFIWINCRLAVIINLSKQFQHGPILQKQTPACSPSSATLITARQLQWETTAPVTNSPRWEVSQVLIRLHRQTYRNQKVSLSMITRIWCLNSKCSMLNKIDWLLNMNAELWNLKKDTRQRGWSLIQLLACLHPSQWLISALTLSLLSGSRPKGMTPPPGPVAFIHILKRTLHSLPDFLSLQYTRLNASTS